MAHEEDFSWSPRSDDGGGSKAGTTNKHWREILGGIATGNSYSRDPYWVIRGGLFALALTSLGVGLGTLGQ